MPANPLSLLDNIRYSNGPDGLKNYFYDLLQNDREKAFETINDQKLKFGTLFLLRNELPKKTGADALNPFYRKVLEIVSELIGKKTGQTEKAMRSDNEDTASALRWMIKTGYIEEAADKDYEQLMESSASLLTKSFKDTTVLQEIAEMIFARYRSGRLIHGLVWAFFEAHSIESLQFIAQRLKSTDKRESELSKKLLYFVPAISEGSGSEGSTLYFRTLQWLQENKPFLYYTGESLQMCSLPRHYAVSWAAKYLCRPVSVNNGKPLLPLNEFENRLSLLFEELPDIQQQQLADFSHMLYRRNIYQWNTWLRLSIAEQTDLALHMTGGLT